MLEMYWLNGFPVSFFAIGRKKCRNVVDFTFPIDFWVDNVVNNVDMRIRRIFVTNFKNLVDCEVRPQLIHAITGCNGSGKSNLLQVLPFVAQLISGSDSERDMLFNGFSSTASKWIPSRLTEKNNLPEDKRSFRFELECELSIGEIDWIVSYALAFTPFELDPERPIEGPIRIVFEELFAKEVGKPGKSRSLIERDKNGVTSVGYTDSRSRPTFTAPSNLSVLKILEVREPESFATHFPVISGFRDALLSTDLIRLNATKLIDNTAPQIAGSFSRTPGCAIDHFAPYKLLKSIREDAARWGEFKAWMDVLCEVKDINLSEFSWPPIGNEDAKKGSSIYNFILIRQHGRWIQPDQLSTGQAMIFGILTALFTFLRHNGPVFLEEPESYLHPKAIVDLLKALRDTSDRTTVLLSTHSPVLLNDLKPEEVTLMRPSDVDGYFTTQPVSEIKEAIAQIARGYISFGEMLQTNFTMDEK